MYEKLQHIKVMDGVLVLGLGLVAVGIGLNVKEKLAGQKVELIKAKVSPTVIQVNSNVVFDIGGEVIKPGVYKMQKGGRISDALIQAGGLTLEADREWIEKNLNRAAVVADGMKIFIPGKGEGPKAAVSPGVLGVVVMGGVIDINTAGIEKLDELPGVGPAIAQKIIDYREKNGGFKDINEIKMVSGIGDKMYEKIKDKIGI
jgi:competence protein ComEA